MSLARLLWAEMVSVESASGVRGAFILEWNVLPNWRRIAAMPVVAIARDTHPPGSIVRTELRMALSRYVLPHPPLADRKTWIDSPFLTASMMVLYTAMSCKLAKKLAFGEIPHELL